MSNAQEHGPVEAPQPHVMPKAFYYGVLGVLVFLTALTVGTAQIDLGPFNVPLAMLIATTKAILVLAFFMHLYFDSRLNLLVFVSTLLFLSIFFVLTMIDTESRDMVDHQRANFLPRDEALAKKREQDKHFEFRPGEQMGETEGRTNYDAHKKEHGGGEHAAAGHAEAAPAHGEAKAH